MCVCVQVCIRCGYVGGGCSLYEYVALYQLDTHTHTYTIVYVGISKRVEAMFLKNLHYLF